MRTRRKVTKDRVSLASSIVALSVGSIAVLAGLVLGGAAYLLIEAAPGPCGVGWRAAAPARSWSTRADTRRRSWPRRDLGQGVLEAVVLRVLCELGVVLVVPIRALLDIAGNQAAADIGHPVSELDVVCDAFSRHDLISAPLVRV